MKKIFSFSIAMLLILGCAFMASCAKGVVFSGISVKTPPSRTAYIEGEMFDKKGISVEAEYVNSGSSKIVERKDVTAYIQVPTEPLTAGQTSVEISYTDGEVTKTAQVEITVVAEETVLGSLVIKEQPIKTHYMPKEVFDKTGLVVEAVYIKKVSKVEVERKDVTANVVCSTNPITEGQTSVQVSYTDNGVTKKVNVAITVEEVSVFGNGDGLLYMMPVWDLTNDDGTPNASISMINTVPDNNIYFKNITDNNLYAYAKFNASSVKNNEKWGKFGLTVLSAEGKGFFYFVDAQGNGTNMTGHAIGYVKMNSPNSYDFPNEKVVHSNFAASDYQGSNYIELAIYRESDVFALYFNGERVSVVSGITGIDAEKTANVGIASFNIMLNVKNYGITNDPAALEDKTIVAEAKDYLFIGDSYIDKGFWTNFNNEYKDMSAENIGVGGTVADYWTNRAADLKRLYVPKNIIVHVGINDINGSTIGAVAVTAEITDLIAKYKEIFSDANIYYVSLSPNNFTPASRTNADVWKVSQAVNAAIKAAAESDAKLNFIDVAKYIGTTSGTAVAQYYMPDGLHFSADGYAIFCREIKSALGIKRVTSAGLGDTSKYATSSGWSISADTEQAENTGVKEQQLYLRGIDSKLSFYAEVDLTVMGKTQEDAYPKVGIALKSATKTVFYFIDAQKPDNMWGSYVVRNNGQDWDWGAVPAYKYLGVKDAGVSYSDGNYKTLAVLKIDSTIYFVADGIVIMTAQNPFDDAEEICVSVMCFNLNTIVKNAETIVDDAALTAKKEELGIK